MHATTASPIAREALDRIGQLYRVEETITGVPPDHRRRERQQRSKPIAEALAAWADETVRKLSRKSELAAAFRYMRGRWVALVRCFDDGRLALDNNPAERALRCVAIGRKNYLFAGSDAGGRRAASMYSLIENAKLNGLNPQLYIPTCSPASPITRPGMSPIFFPGTGSSSSPIAPPLNWRLHRALTEAQWLRVEFDEVNAAEERFESARHRLPGSLSVSDA
jgi:hypothetical protein